MMNRTPANNIKIRLGDYNLRAATEQYPHEEYSVKRKVVNENYNPATYQNDIALLELNQDVIYRPHILPICLPSKGATSKYTNFSDAPIKQNHFFPLHLSLICSLIVNDCFFKYLLFNFLSPPLSLPHSFRPKLYGREGDRNRLGPNTIRRFDVTRHLAKGGSRSARFGRVPNMDEERRSTGKDLFKYVMRWL